MALFVIGTDDGDVAIPRVNQTAAVDRHANDGSLPTMRQLYIYTPVHGVPKGGDGT